MTQERFHKKKLAEQTLSINIVQHQLNRVTFKSHKMPIEIDENFSSRNGNQNFNSNGQRGSRDRGHNNIIASLTTIIIGWFVL